MELLPFSSKLAIEAAEAIDWSMLFIDCAFLGVFTLYPAVTKGALISEIVSLELQLPKKVPNYSPEHYSPKKKLLTTTRGSAVIWHLFLEIGAKVKNFLRLSHL